MGNAFRLALAALMFCFLGSQGSAFAADPDDEDDDGEGIGEGQSPDEDGPQLTERERRILELFKASVKGFNKGRIHLEYDFERQTEDLVEDWRPTLDQAQRRVRWARGSEGTPSTVEHGIIVGDSGEWYHNAVFLADLDVRVDMMSVARFKSGNILAPVFYNEKKKLSLGANCGSQVVCLKALKHAKPPLGKERMVNSCDRQVIGYRYEGNLFKTFAGKISPTDTGKAPRFAEGFESGHVGLAWNGSIQCFIFTVTMEGTLDPAWVAKQLGESAPVKDEKKKPATGGGSAGGGGGKSEKGSGAKTDGGTKKDQAKKA